MSKTFNISTIFSAVDKLSAPVKKIESNIDKLANKVHPMAAKMSQGFGKVDTSAAKTAREVDKLKNKFQFRNQIGHINSLIGAMGRLASKTASIGKSLLPGWGTAAVVGAAGYGAYRAVQNASQYEGIETSTKGLIASSPQFKRTMSIADRERLAVEQGKLAEWAGNVSVGQFKDYANMQNVNLARGIAPDKRLMAAYGSLAASMPNMDDQAGQFLETLKSISRGEMATADNIPGVKGHIDKKNHEAYLMKDGTKYQLGAADSKNYSKNLNAALTIIAEKYFKELGEMQGKTFEAKFSTMQSGFTRTLDAMVRKTSWWEQAIKPGLDGLTTSIVSLQPKFVELSQSIFNKLMPAFTRGGQSIDTFVSETVQKMIDAVNALEPKDIDAFKTGLIDTGKAIFGVIGAINSFLPTLQALINNLADPNNAAVDRYVNDAESKGYQKMSLGQSIEYQAKYGLAPFADDGADFSRKVNDKLAEHRNAQIRPAANGTQSIPGGVLNLDTYKLSSASEATASNTSMLLQNSQALLQKADPINITLNSTTNVDAQGQSNTTTAVNTDSKRPVSVSNVGRSSRGTSARGATAAW